MPIPRYHVNPKTGKPGRCVAARRCRFGGDSVHYPSEQDARLGYERAMMREQYKNAQVDRGSVALLPENVVRGNQFDIEPGTYLLGDPYIVVATQDQAGWNDVIASVENQFGWENDVTDPAQEKQIAVGALYRGEPLLALKSWHGAGLHWSVGPTRRLPSDTGLMGFVTERQLAALGMSPEEAEARKFGMKIDITEKATVWRDEQGVMIVGGRLIVCHNDLIQSHWFQSLATVDGVNNKVPTSETYNFILERAKLWAEDPALSSK